MNDEAIKNHTGYCPAHVGIERESGIMSTEIKNLVQAYKQLYSAVEKIRIDMDRRVPRWVLIVITALSSVCAALIARNY